MKFNVCVLFLGMVCLPGLIFAQLSEIGGKSMSLSVEDLFQRGVEHSLQVKTSQFNEEIANEHEMTTKSARLPEIRIGMTEGYIGQPVVYSDGGLKGKEHPEMPDWLHNYQVSLMQPLYEGGRIRYDIERKAFAKQIARLGTERDKAEIKLSLVFQYLNLLKLYKQQEVLARNIEESERQLHDIQQLKKQEMVTQNDVIRSELQLTNYRLALLEIKNNIQIVSQSLDVALGFEEDLLLEPDTALLNMLRPLDSYENDIEQAYREYPEMKILRSDKDLLKKEVQIAKAGNIPSLSLHASNALERPITSVSPALDRFMNTWNVSVSLSYRLSSLYHNRHDIRAARLSDDLQDVREEQQKQEIRIHVKSAYVKYREAEERIRALTVYLYQANENYRIMQNKYRNQLAILTDLLDAENIRLDAEMQLTVVRADLVYIWYQLQRIKGEL